MFSIIAAIGKNHELGKNNQLVFHIKEDMQFFRDTTRGHTVIMGHKTWDSLPGKLPGRKNIVISRGDVEGADEVVHDLPQFIAENENTDEEIFVIGGAFVYNEFLKYAKNLYLTEIDAAADADTFFPQFDKSKYEKTIIKEGQENGVKFVFTKYHLT